MVYEREDIEGLDSSTSDASTHLGGVRTRGVSDPMVDCKKCKMRWREDQIDDSQKCPNCGGELTEPRMFTHVQDLYGAGGVCGTWLVYMRPETAQVFTSISIM